MQSLVKITHNHLRNNISRGRGTRVIGRLIHENKSFLRTGGLLIVEVDWNLVFEKKFFMGYKFELIRKFSSKGLMRIEVSYLGK